MKEFFKTKIHWISAVLILFVVIYIVKKAAQQGTDINVYLHASQQFFNGENIYANNPYNQYLYSPLFALLLWPISFFDFSIARIIWALLNIVLALRTWYIIQRILEPYIVKFSVQKSWFVFCVLFISLGYVNHNLILGQITLFILWLTFEGLYSIQIEEKLIKGSFLLALGIIVKIVPAIGLMYLFLKGKYRALFFVALFLLCGLFIPGLVKGFQYNQELLITWANTINPKSNKYILENDNSCMSLNAFVPAYLYAFEDPEVEQTTSLRRQIASLSFGSVVVIVQVSRIAVLLSFVVLLYRSYRDKERDGLNFLWEMSYFFIVLLLFFPHQQKYAMYFYVPSGIYLLLYLNIVFKKESIQSYTTYILSSIVAFFLILSSLMGRDIIGDFLLNLLDYFHILGIMLLFFLFVLHFITPQKIRSLKI